MFRVAWSVSTCSPFNALQDSWPSGASFSKAVGQWWKIPPSYNSSNKACSWHAWNPWTLHLSSKALSALHQSTSSYRATFHPITGSIADSRDHFHSHGSAGWHLHCRCNTRVILPHRCLVLEQRLELVPKGEGKHWTNCQPSKRSFPNLSEFLMISKFLPPDARHWVM